MIPTRRATENAPPTSVKWLSVKLVWVFCVVLRVYNISMNYIYTRMMIRILQNGSIVHEKRIDRSRNRSDMIVLKLLDGVEVEKTYFLQIILK